MEQQSGEGARRLAPSCRQSDMLPPFEALA
jgi:hypothetical protein